MKFLLGQYSAYHAGTQNTVSLSNENIGAKTHKKPPVNFPGAEWISAAAISL